GVMPRHVAGVDSKTLAAISGIGPRNIDRGQFSAALIVKEVADTTVRRKALELLKTVDAGSIVKERRPVQTVCGHAGSRNIGQCDVIGGISHGDIVDKFISQEAVPVDNGARSGPDELIFHRGKSIIEDAPLRRRYHRVPSVMDVTEIDFFLGGE